MKRWLILVSLILIVTIVGLISVAKVSTRTPHAGVAAARVDNSKSINGAKNPELIPDNVAYRMLFRLIADRKSDDEKRHIRSYLMQAGITEKSDIEALLALADTFHQRAYIFDQKMGALIARYHPNHSNYTPEDKELLNKLQLEGEVIVAEIVAALPSKLSRKGLAKLRVHVHNRVKRNIKIIDG